MRILVGTLTGKKIVINDMEGSDLIEFLGQVVEEKEGIPHSHQRWIYAGKELEQGRSFNDYNIQNDSLLHMVLRLGGSEEEIPSPAMIAHGGMQINPPINHMHDCGNSTNIDCYVKVYKSTRPLHYLKPLTLTFDLSKLCLPQPCYNGISKKDGAGFILAEKKVNPQHPNNAWMGTKQNCHIRVFELKNGEYLKDSIAKMIRNRKLVVSEKLSTVKETENFGGGKFYGAQSESETPRGVIVRKFFPRGSDKWRCNATYLVFFNNSTGGFRWIFKTSHTDYDDDKKDEEERVEFVWQNFATQKVSLLGSETVFSSLPLCLFMM